MTQPVTVGLLWHSANATNLGVGALTVSQIAIVEQVARALAVPVRFVILGWRNPEPAYVSGENVEVCNLRTRDLVMPGGLMRALGRCDLVLDIGAGDSFADIYGVSRALKILVSKFVVLASGKPLVLSPQTIGPFRQGWSRMLARLALGRIRAVLTRDALSTAALRELGYKGEVIEATDLALRLPHAAPERVADGPVRVGLNVSGLLMNGGYSGANMFGLTVDYRALARRMVEWFLDQGCEVHLIGHVITDAMPVEDDHRAALTLADAYPACIVAPRFGSPSEAKSYIAGMDFFCGSRMHACIAAFSSGVPVMPIGYSRKFAGMFGTLGYRHVADCRADDADTVMEKVAEAFENRVRLAAEIQVSLLEGERRLGAYEALLAACLTEVAQ